MGKAVLIGLTIIVGVFITILLVNQPTRSGLGAARSPFEISLEDQISNYLRRYAWGSVDSATLDAMRQGLRAEAGLDLPYWPRHLLWTYKALTFDWGRLTVVNAQQLDFSRRTTAGARDIVLQYFPNTLLLMGTGYLLVFLLGIPLALYLARHHGGKLDRILAILSPISSVPSWVIAILLIALFAVQLRWLPMSGMFEAHKPEQPAQYVLVLAQHMVLPVTAIVISLLFQLVYAWRTFFVIYAEEDFVELARAKGLAVAVVERQYVLRPALPYVITSFALSLIGFWQMTMALEVVFQWPGLGWLYIQKALPNFWGESIYPGELIIAVGIVVIFAYLLGILVFILDIVYVIVDPRIRLRSAGGSVEAAKPVSSGAQRKVHFQPSEVRLGRQAGEAGQSLAGWLAGLGHGLEDWWYSARDGARSLLRQLGKDPAAVFGMSVIALLFAGSAYAVVVLPYEKIGSLWDTERLKGRISVPRLAAPAWTNAFARSPRLSSLILNEADQQTTTSSSALHGTWTEKTVRYRFDYPYAEFPSEVYLYLKPTYTSAHPFVSLVWTYPDGRQLELRGTAVEGEESYDFGAGLNINRLLGEHPEWRTWYKSGPPEPTPPSDFLFAEAGSNQLRPMGGTYQVEVKSLLFEPGSNVESQLVLLGQVYGAAGTDYWRRDLVVPLLWGMPFTLVFGLLGATATTVLAMLLSAAGVWLGGWVDALIQRITEVNMILPVLAIGVLASALLGISLWVILGAIVLMNVFGAPTKTFRSAFIQEKEAPYIEAARAYGASDFRIIGRYLVPRILPTLIPQLVILVPSFVFLEATLGIFNIHSAYPTWGRIIYDGLSKGALYGSRFWVLEPISLLLLTGLAFAMFGSALERALNPRMISDISTVLEAPRLPAGETRPRETKQAGWNPGVAIAMAALTMCLVAAIWVRFRELQTRAALTGNSEAASAISETLPIATVPPATTAPLLPDETSPATSSPTPPPTMLATAEYLPDDSAPAVLTGNPPPATYQLQRGEYPFCIARRYNLDPHELLAMNGMLGQEVFYAGTTLQMPQSGRTFRGDRALRAHPAVYLVSRTGETIHGVACAFGDVEPLSIAQANNLPVDAELLVGQQLQVP